MLKFDEISAPEDANRPREMVFLSC